MFPRFSQNENVTLAIADLNRPHLEIVNLPLFQCRGVIVGGGAEVLDPPSRCKRLLACGKGVVDSPNHAKGLCYGYEFGHKDLPHGDELLA